MSIKAYKTGAFLVLENTVTGDLKEFLATAVQIRKKKVSVDEYEVLVDWTREAVVFLADLVDEAGDPYTENAWDTFRFSVNAASGIDAVNVTYDNTGSGLTATDVQAAIDEVFANAIDSVDVIYDNATSGLAAANVQAAIDETVVLANAYDISFAASDETTPLTTGNGKVTIFAPRDFTLVSLFAGVTTLGTTSGTTTVQVQKNGVDILSTALTIDQGEYTSLTAATPAVISTTAFTKGDRISVDIDAVSGGATEAGLKITLIGTMA